MGSGGSKVHHSRRHPSPTFTLSGGQSSSLGGAGRMPLPPARGWAGDLEGTPEPAAITRPSLQIHLSNATVIDRNTGQPIAKPLIYEFCHSERSEESSLFK